tara:strand:+ start:581 stop:1192 length:612 start_codon:yes stop_codon:yes gene_type:complete
MTVNHRTLTGLDLHEPKGADTAGEGKFYKSDGSGGGTWEFLAHGFGVYVDSKTTATVQTLSSTPSVIECDSGGGVNEAYLPRAIRGSGHLWDSTNDKVTPINQGDTYSVRLTFKTYAKAASPGFVTVVADTGLPTASTITLNIGQQQSSLFATPPTIMSFDFHMAVGPSFFVNGCRFFAFTDTGTLTINEVTLYINRISDGEG